MFEETMLEEEGPKIYPPNNTIYIQNLNEKVPIEELKDSLFGLFEEFGDILDIIAKKNIRMRGQAFIVFRDINSAMEAKRRVDQQEFFGKTLKISFAKEKSDLIAKNDGTFHIRQRPDNYFQMKFQQKFVNRPKKLKKQERQKNVSRKVQNQNNMPNNLLFCEGLNETINLEALGQKFSRFPGLVDIRLAPKNYAFIQFEDDFKAGTALAALNDCEINGVPIKLSYAKK